MPSASTTDVDWLWRRGGDTAEVSGRGVESPRPRSPTRPDDPAGRTAVGRIVDPGDDASRHPGDTLPARFPPDGRPTADAAPRQTPRSARVEPPTLPRFT